VHSYHFISRAVTLLFLILYGLSAFGQSNDPTAIVHLKFVDLFGKDLREFGEGKVALFEATDSRNFARSFAHNTAKGIPFGVYRLRARLNCVYPARNSKDKACYVFYHTDYIVNVFQREVWVVVQLDAAIEDGPLRYQIAGTVTGVPDCSGIWIRAQGLLSSMVADAPCGIDGKFEIGGLPFGTYLLTTRQGDRILDLRSIQVPPKGQEHSPSVVVPVEIKLKP
jgi:hypothetical protein